MTREKMREQLDRCCGPAPKPYVKPKPLSGLEKELRLQEVKQVASWKLQQREDVRA